MKDIFKGRHFEKDIIILAISYYYRFPLSYRNISEILQQRSIKVHPTTVMRWVNKYGETLYNKWKNSFKSRIKSWRLDETYVKIKGVWHYFYRAIDKNGLTLDMMLSKKRDCKSTKKFLVNLIKMYHKPVTIITDKAPSLKKAIDELTKEGFLKNTNHIRIKYLNNIIEQDHRAIKRIYKVSTGYKSISQANNTLKGIEVVHALYKEKRNDNNTHFVFCAFKEVKNLLLNHA